MNIYHPYTIFPLGDSALTIDFGNVINDEINKKVLQLYYQIKEAHIPYISDVIPAYSSLTVCYEVYSIYANDHSSFETMAELIENIAAGETKSKENISRVIEVPVCYATKYAYDLNEIASQKNLSPEDVIAIHTSKAYRVYMLGFLPGFAYMGEVNDEIAVPRKNQPRINVEAGSVGIAGKQTGIYPLLSPGGWQIIGRTPLTLFDKDAVNPVLFQPGDEVKFYSISEHEFADYQRRYS